MTWDSGPALSSAGGEVEGSAELAGLDERYERRGLLGVGGMGRVYAAHDRLLRRDVALKEAATPELAARLGREVRLTAQLEHPGIVAVYDAGEVDGVPWYAMRLVRGRTLAERLQGAGAEERLALVPHLHAACQAVAYAHDMGVVHRDLKPTNLMVGQFGETQVMDWGLAGPVPDAAEHWSRIASGPPRKAEGTSAYMAPEQAAGGAPDRRSDVYSLGRSLEQLLDGVDAPELHAVAARATAREAADRYASAAELAAEIGRWLAGRRVHAHEYTPGELFVRLVKAWRAPLVVAGVLVPLVVAAVVVGALRTAEQRETAERHLARALVQQAGLALSEDRRPEAEILAAHALLLRESPEARGVLAAMGGARPERVRRVDLPEACQRRAVVSPGMDRVACAPGGRLGVYDLDGALLYEHAGELESRASWTGGRVLFQSEGQIWAWSERGVRVLGDVDFQYSLAPGPVGVSPGLVLLVDEPQLPTLEICADSRASTAGAGDRVVSVCGEGVHVYDRDGRLEREVLTEPPPAWSTLAPLGDWLLAGTFTGDVEHFDPRLGHREVVLEGFGGTIVDVHAVPRTPYVVAMGEHGSVRIGDTQLGAWVGSLPGRWSRVSVGGDGEVVLVGDHLEIWRLPQGLRPLAWELGAGVSQLAVSEDGQRVAYGLGTGDVGLVERTGPVQTWRWQDQVAKTVALLGDHVVASAGDGGYRWLTLDGEVVGEGVRTRFRRLGRIGDRVWGLPWGGAPLLLDGVGQVEVSTDAIFYEGSSSASGDVAVWLSDGGVWRFDGSLVRVTDHDDLVAADVGDGGSPLVLAARHRLCIDERCVEVDESILDVAYDGAWLAVGTTGGDVLMFRDLEPVAVLRGHTGRVASVELGDGWLVSGSWDGTLRFWDLAVLRADPQTLVRDRERVWGLTLDEVLSR